MPVTVRRCTPADGPILRTLRLAMLDIDPLAFNVDPDLAAARPADWWDSWASASAAGSSQVVFVAESQAQPVAMIAAEHVDDTIHTGALWVAPAYRGQGIADKLLDCVETWAHDTRASSVELSVAQGNQPALRIYQRRHYVDTGRRLPTRHDHSELVLTKPAGT